MRNVYRVLLESLMEDPGTDKFIWFWTGTTGDYFVKTERDIQISCKSGNTIISFAVISFL